MGTLTKVKSSSHSSQVAKLRAHTLYVYMYKALYVRVILKYL
jgi:hypothetical protein